MTPKLIEEWKEILRDSEHKAHIPVAPKAIREFIDAVETEQAKVRGLLEALTTVREICKRHRFDGPLSEMDVVAKNAIVMAKMEDA